MGCQSGEPGHVGQAKSKPVGWGGSLPTEAGLLPCVPQTFSALPNVSLPLQESIFLRSIPVRCCCLGQILLISSVMAHLSRQVSAVLWLLMELMYIF